MRATCRPPVPFVALGLLAVSLAGCGGGSDDGAAGDPVTDKLAQILAQGTLVGFFEPDYP